MRRRLYACIAAVIFVVSFKMVVFAYEAGSILVETCGGAVALYKVGTVNGQVFVLDDTYGGDSVTLEDTLSPELAAWLDGQVKSGQIKAPDLYGKVLFPDLEEGLYLVAQRSSPSGSVPFQPFLVSIPWDGDQWHVSIDLEITEQLPRTEDPGNPMLFLWLTIISLLGLWACIYHGNQSKV